MTRIRSIVLASRNRGKLREIIHTLGELPVEMVGLESFGDIAAPDETAATFAENARDKATYYARATGEWCLADDSGLEVDALNGEPGVRSARYAANDCKPDADRKTIDHANNARLLADLAGVPDEKRTARFVCHLALADGKQVIIETSGAIEGRIAHAPRGENGFGYDPLFFVPTLGCTTAQLAPEKKNAVSHRGQAVRQFAALLRSMLAEND
ncbi:MAG: RdgB/HAM1 family non-canonical purine NTP pyrophosphatase [Planctomycetota bacterium]|nr:RdgB/HAM1 family non-canonical purine NTP pyrophosphatase [Planctomycetota bacterium]